ncbi:MAG: AAA family ATPase, partial [bacterium]|nr:AAA family ATPase [bacterium]
MMTKQTFKRIPYGISDYVALVDENHYYVDKTMYLPMIEDAGKYLFFIRPRRFGKSLLLSMMHCYYDVYYNDRFDELFKDRWIHKNPTEQQGKYLMLALNFSAVDPDRKHLESSFLSNISEKVDLFLFRYKSVLNPDGVKKLEGELDGIKSAPVLLHRLAGLCQKSDQQLFIIIDEYDNFANTILTSSGHSAYKDLTHGEGFFRAFFNFLKEATTGSGAPISRLFITGVSPVTLDDVTSGFNIGENISIESDFNRLLGFTEADIQEMIQYYRDNGKMDFDTAEIHVEDDTLRSVPLSPPARLLIERARKAAPGDGDAYVLGEGVGAL